MSLGGYNFYFNLVLVALLLVLFNWMRHSGRTKESKYSKFEMWQAFLIDLFVCTVFVRVFYVDFMENLWTDGDLIPILLSRVLAIPCGIVAALLGRIRPKYLIQTTLLNGVYILLTSNLLMYNGV